jgi:hypothetical protein
MLATRVLPSGLLLALLALSGSAHSQGVLSRVVVAGQPVPGGGTFEHFSIESQPVVAPVNAKSQIAFFATLLRAPAAEGLFVSSGSRIAKVAAEGDPVPGGGTISGFGRHPIPAINRTGSVAFAAAVSGGKTVEGIFVSSVGRLRVVARAGEAAPGMPSGTLANLDSPALNDRGDVAFLATVRRGRETVEAIYLLAGGRLRKVVAQEDPAPAGGTFAAFGAPVLNNLGTVAFGAVIEGRAVPGGVFVANGDRVRMLVGAGDETPLGGIFAKFSERVALNDAGTVAFTGMLKGAPVESAIFVAEQGRLRKIVALGEPAPGGGTFANFGFWPALSAMGTVAFTGAVDQGPTSLAVFVASPSEMRRLASVGDPLPEAGTLASFGLYPSAAMSPAGHVTFATAPTATGEGSEGIFRTDTGRPP